MAKGREKTGKLKTKSVSIREKSPQQIRVGLCQLQEWVRHKGLGSLNRRKGKNPQGSHGAGEPARLSRCRAAGSLGPRQAVKRLRWSATFSTFRPPARSAKLDCCKYNCAGVGVRHGLNPIKTEHDRFLGTFAWASKSIIVDNGIILLKIWLEVGILLSTIARFHDSHQRSSATVEIEPYGPPLLLSDGIDYSRARDEMLEKTDTQARAVGYIVRF